VWGSTYLFIRFAVAAMPPLLMAGVRMLLAGGAMLAWMLARGLPPPRAREWGWGVALGALFFLCGNGSVVWSEQSVPSGLVALAVATVPLWVVLFQWLFRFGPAPVPMALFGIVLGFAGLVVLVRPGGSGAGGWNALTTAVMLVGPMAWAMGTLLARRVSQPASPFAAAALQMIGGGALLLATAGATGEFARFSWNSLTPLAVGSVLYLVVAGSVVAYSAYVWLLRHQPPATVATYAYVNPLVAVVLGWAFAGEQIGPRVLVSALFIVTAVAMITRTAGRPRTRA
jgi:drug/metabolite transporter (DMT)-like permease